MKTLSFPINDVQLTAEGNLVIITTPSKDNAKGVFVMNAAQTARICQRIGIPSALAVKHIISLSNGTSKLTIQSEDVKAGEAWINPKTGETGTYTKDWTKLSNHEVKLGLSAQMKVAEFALQAAFANPMAFAPMQTASPKAPVVVEEPANTETANVEANNAAGSEEPTV